MNTNHEYIFMDNRQIHSQRDRQTDKMGKDRRMKAHTGPPEGDKLGKSLKIIPLQEK